MTYDATLGAEEKVASLFQPDDLLPAQYFDTVRRKANSEPEEKLMLAILEDAIDCFQKYIFARDGRRKGIFLEAEDWILEENSDRLFSFENICEVLGFNPKYVRKGLLLWKEMELAERPKSKNGRG